MARHTLTASLLLVLVSLSTAQADWPFSTKDGGPRRGSKEYYEMRANEPAGARQVYKHGKLWPPYPRPVGDHQTFAHKYHHAHYWPFPYTCEDRASVEMVRDIQVANGWQNQTTLFEYHFDPLTNELNSSGKAHLRWILVHVPVEFQQVTVAIANEPHKTSLRTANVQREVTHLVGNNPGFQIATRLADPVGRPAAEVQYIFRSAQESMPPPVLSQSAGDVGSSSDE